MRILYYIPNIKINSGGIYPYLMTVLKIFQKKNDPNIEFFLFCANPSKEILEISQIHRNFILIPQEEIISNAKEPSLFETIFNTILTKLRFKLQPKLDNINKVILKYQIDIIYSPFQEIPLATRIPTICTMHDLQELHFPDFFSPEDRAWRAVNYNAFIKKSDAVIVSYEHVKKDIIKYFQKESYKIHTCLLDMQNLWFEQFQEPINSSQNVKTKKYILYPAATWEHKNHINLIKAFAVFREQHNIDLHLYCTGNKTDHFQKVIEPLIHQLHLSECVHFLGIVDEKQLFHLYKNCEATVVPTLYEAGSFPLMESILMNIPVICSNTTSLPETIGDRQFAFDPNNTEEMADLIFKITQDPEFISGNLNNNKLAAKKLIKNDFAEKMILVFKSLIQKK